MIANRMNAQIVKICSMGLTTDHLGKTVSELRDHFHTLKSKFDFNVCGEGGEYESAVFDCPLFKTHKIVAKKQEVVVHDKNEVCPVAYLQYGDLELEAKSDEEIKLDQEALEKLIDSRKETPLDHLVA